jgi:dihydroneopterin aldolase
MSDEIHILGLEMPVRIGVPEVERASWQVVTADIRLSLRREFDDMQDDISATVDYQRAAREACDVAASRPRKLLEVLAADLVKFFLANDAVTAVEVFLRKRVLPQTDAVAVRMRREKK